MPDRSSSFLLPSSLIAGTLFFCLLTLWAEKTGGSFKKILFKTLASLGFLSLGLIFNPLETRYGIGILLGLFFSLLGDVALAFPTKVAFLSGMGLFALAHLGYISGFILRSPLDPTLGAIAVLPFFFLALFFYLRFRRRIERGMMIPLTIYSILLLTMVGLAVSALNLSGGMLAGVGAILFVLSDLWVARDHLIQSSFLNKLIGLPLYYSAQILIALSLRFSSG